MPPQLQQIVSNHHKHSHVQGAFALLALKNKVFVFVLIKLQVQGRKSPSCARNFQIPVDRFDSSKTLSYSHITSFLMEIFKGWMVSAPCRHLPPTPHHDYIFFSLVFTELFYLTALCFRRLHRSPTQTGPTLALILAQEADEFGSRAPLSARMLCRHHHPDARRGAATPALCMARRLRLRTDFGTLCARIQSPSWAHDEPDSEAGEESGRQDHSRTHSTDMHRISNSNPDSTDP